MARVQSLKSLVLGSIRNLLWLMHPRLGWGLSQRLLARRTRKALVSPRYQSIGRQQMTHLLKDVATDAEIDDAVQRFIEFYLYEGELRWHPEQSMSTRVEGVEHLQAAHAQGRGVVLHFAHHGLYSGMFGAVRRASGIDVSVLCFDGALGWNVGPNVRQHILVVRRGGELVYAGEGKEGIARRLAEGRIVAIASDAPGNSVVSFAGHDVKVASGAVWAARDANCPIVTIDSWRDEDGTVLLRLEPPIDPADHEDPKALLQQLVATHEKAILAWPEATYGPTVTWPLADAPGAAAAPAEAGSRGRFGLTLLDQAISGGSNVAFSILAARLLEPAGFGYFGVAFLTYTLALFVARALVCEPILIDRDPASRRTLVLGSSIAVGAGLGALIACAGIGLTPFNGPLGWALVALGAAMPLLALQDTLRYVGIAEHRPQLAVIVDGAWLVFALVAAAGLAILGNPSTWEFVAAWGGAGALAGLVGLFLTTGGRVAVHLGWVRDSWKYASRYLAAGVALQGSALVVVALVGILAGATGVALLAGAALINRPYSVFQIAATTFGTSEVAKATEAWAIERTARILTVIAGVAALVNGVILLSLPDVLGRLILGASWEIVEPAALAIAVQTVMMGLSTGPRAGLFGLRRVDRTLPITTLDAILLVALGTAGTAIDGPILGIWFVNAGLAVTAVLWWRVFGREAARPATPEEAPAASPVTA